jgi:hydrogenase maturation factor
MCLAVTGRIVRLEGDDAVLDVDGRAVVASRVLVPDALVEDWVTVGAGWLLARITANEARSLRELTGEAAATPQSLGVGGTGCAG